MEHQQPLPFAPGIQCDNRQLNDRIKSDLELLRQFQPEKFIGDRDSLSLKSANYHPDSDEKEAPFDLLKRDGMRSGRRGWTAKAEAPEVEAEISEWEVNIETTTSIATTSIPNKMTCHRSWKLHSDGTSLIPHLKLCKGKCQGCKELGLPCIFLIGMSKSCNNCKETGCGMRWPYNSQTFRVEKNIILRDLSPVYTTDGALSSQTSYATM